MRRSYNLSALSALVTMTAQTVLNSLLAGVAALFLLLPRLLAGSGGDLGRTLSGVLELFSDPVFGTVFALAYVVSMVAAILLAGLIRRRVEPVRPEKRSLSAGQFLVVVLVCFGLWGVGALVGNFPQFFAPVETGGLMDGLPFLLLAMVGAPVFEELIFRKFLLDRVGPYGEGTAVLFSALLFGMAHQNAGQFFLAFLLGAVFALVYLRTGQIAYTMALHFLINTVASLDSLALLLTGGDYAEAVTVGWFVLAGALTLAGLVTLLLCRKSAFWRWAPNRVPDANRAAFWGWGVRLSRILAVVAIAGTGLLYLVMGVERSGPWGLLHLIPMGLAVAVIYVVSGRTARETQTE